MIFIKLKNRYINFRLPFCAVMIAMVLSLGMTGYGMTSGAYGSPVDSVSVDEENPYLLLVAQAEQAVADSNYIEAIERINEAVAIRPSAESNYMLLANVAELYNRTGQDSLALDSYSRAIEMAREWDGSLAWILNKRAKTYLKLGKDIEAYKDFDEVLKTDTIDIESRYYHGLIALFGGDMEIAGRDFAVMADHYPKALATSMALGTLYSMTGREDKAIPYLEKVIEESPSPEYFASLAGCQLVLGRLSDASATIGDGLRQYPSDPELFYYRAWLNKELYRIKDAEADARTAVSLGANPKKVNALFDK